MKPRLRKFDAIYSNLVAESVEGTEDGFIPLHMDQEFMQSVLMPAAAKAGVQLVLARQDTFRAWGPAGNIIEFFKRLPKYQIANPSVCLNNYRPHFYNNNPFLAPEGNGVRALGQRMDTEYRRQDMCQQVKSGRWYNLYQLDQSLETNVPSRVYHCQPSEFVKALKGFMAEHGVPESRLIAVEFSEGPEYRTKEYTSYTVPPEYFSGGVSKADPIYGNTVMNPSARCRIPEVRDNKSFVGQTGRYLHRRKVNDYNPKNKYKSRPIK